MFSEKRKIIWFSIPGEAFEILEKRAAAEGMTVRQHVESTVGYDLWAEKPHWLSGQAIRAGGEEAERFWREVIADFGKPNKTGSYFEHRAAEFLRASPEE